MKFDEKLVKLRKAKTLSQEELADKLGVSRQAISRWELGSTYPDVPNLLKISKLFDVSADYLINDDKDVFENAFLEKVPSINEDVTTNDEKKEQNRHLIISLFWAIAAACFLVAAIINMNIIYVGFAFADSFIAGIHVCNYFKLKQD